jgi:nicotinate-nucleotide pyrophosphorylase (carboxylating)
MTIQEIIHQALAEDLGSGDHTSLATIPERSTGSSRLLIKEKGIVAGVEMAREVFRQVDSSLQFSQLIADGSEVNPGDVVFIVTGSSRSILAGERLALNFMQRMSGIATATRQLTEQLAGTRARLLDTRKTTPLLREIEKIAVRTGGGENHRMGLYDMILIKDNHVDFAGGIPQAIRAVRKYMEEQKINLKIEIEVRNFSELDQVIEEGGVHRIMLDNFTPDSLKKAVDMINGRYETEASGGITQDTIREFALTGVDFISVGALTHHIRSLDMSLKAIS